MRVENRMTWTSVLGLTIVVVVATFAYALALVVRDDTDDADGEDEADGAFDGDRITEFD
jgi:hypothetical protein